MSDNKMGSNGNSKLSDVYLIYRSTLEHEDNLFGSRLNWLLTGNSFLLFPYVYSVFNSAKTEAAAEIAALLRVGIPSLGVIFASVVSLSVLAALYAVNEVVDKFPDIVRQDPLLPKTLYPLTNHTLNGLSPSWLPVFMIMFWVVVLFTDDFTTVWIDEKGGKQIRESFELWPPCYWTVRGIGLTLLLYLIYRTKQLNLASRASHRKLSQSTGVASERKNCLGGMLTMAKSCWTRISGSR